MKHKIEKYKLYQQQILVFLIHTFCCYACFTLLPYLAFANTNNTTKNKITTPAIEFEQIEVIQVIGKKHQYTNDATLSSDMIFIDETVDAFQSVSDIVSDIPGVDLNGQGGLFQVFSIRGLSGARVQTQISGIPIVSERRAGTSTSFISPYLIDNIEIIKGASSTFYGSGAIGGVTQITPKHFESLAMSINSENGKQKIATNIGWGNENNSIAFSYRQAKNGQTADKIPLNNQYQHYSASFLNTRQLSDDLNLTFFLLPSYAKDIGKANSDDFLRKKLTLYPKEQHLLSQLALVADDWQLNLAMHQQALTTSVLRYSKRKNQVRLSSTDFTLNFIKDFSFNDNNFSDIFGQWGVDQQYRDNVKANELQTNFYQLEQKKLIKQNTWVQNLAANQYQAGLFANINTHWSSLYLDAGARINFISQKSFLPNNTQNKNFNDQHLTSFASMRYEITPQLKLFATISRGFRYPSLSERFYSGTTGRGTTLGNINLKAETSVNREINFQYKAITNSTNNYQVNLALFDHEIKNYIERIQIDKNTRSYKNVSSGHIKGLELSIQSNLNAQFNALLSGHYLTGKSNNNQPLSDVSANKIQFALTYQETQWQAQLKFKHRFTKKYYSAGEQFLPQVNTIQAHFNYDLSPSWQCSFWLNNALNKQYLLSADKKSVFSAERQIGFSIHWQG
ncbi:MAG: TonB-dependent receptor [Alteromonadaceae bacterium]|nr:TonB-dependent receptor [Alteromonadaceae bacterium]